MFKYQLLLFYRNFKRNRLFSLINLFGLSTGICVTLLIYAYVSYEYTFNDFHENGNNIYRVNQTFIWGDNVDEQFGSTGPGVGIAVQEELPEVVRMTRLYSPGNFLVTNELGNHTAFKERNVLAADSNFFEMFSFELLKGDKHTILTAPNNLILTEEMSQKYFEKEDAMGKLLSFDFGGVKQTYKVAGIAANIPENSHIQFDMLISMNSISRVKKSNWSWVWTTFVTYVELNNTANIDDVRRKLESIPPKYAEKSLQIMMNQSFSEYIDDGHKWELFLQPLADIHFNTDVNNRFSSPVDKRVMYSLSIAAIFIVVLSCINFTNLSTAQHLKRARFTGIRKVLGSSRWQLGLHFILESFLFCLIALFIGLISVYYLMPWFNNFVGQELEFNLFHNPELLLIGIGLLIFMTMLSGIYPAVFMSTFRPIDAMKGKVNSGKGSIPLRNGLVVFQFAVSLILIACTMILFQQLRFSHQRDVGFERDNIISINNLEWINNSKTFVDDLNQLPGVINAAWCTSLPPNLWGADQFLPINAPAESIPLNYTTADERYVQTLGLNIRLGRSFSESHSDDVNSIVINEEAIRKIGWNLDESVLGKEIGYQCNEGQCEVKFKVIGVVEDFNYWTLDAPIEPFALFHDKARIYAGDNQFAAVSIAFDDTSEAGLDGLLNQIEGKWDQFAPDMPFEYSFVDESFKRAFRSEEQFGSILTVFAGMAMFIAFLGLLGIIIYAIEQRIKEIGIRKIMGANFLNIAFLISKEHIKLILFAIVVSTPITIWLMNGWLEDYEYRISISPFVFVATSLILIIIAASISGYHTFRASRINPVDILREE